MTPPARDESRSDGASELPSWLWLWMPLGLALVPYVAHAVSEPFYEARIRTELGLIESATALFLAVCVVASVGVFRRARSLPAAWLRPAIGLYALGAFYFLGEEVSWGQHWFGWATPEALAARNEQGETNLHNIGGWTEAVLDQGPRGLLTAAALVGGVLMPLFLHARRRTWSEARDAKAWIVPTRVVLPSAVLALVSSLPKKIAKLSGGEVPHLLDIQGGESKELFLAAFLMLFALSVRVRLGRSSREPIA